MPRFYNWATIRVACTITHSLTLLSLQQSIKVRNALSAKCFSNDQECEAHHGCTTIPVFSPSTPETIGKRLLPAYHTHIMGIPYTHHGHKQTAAWLSFTNAVAYLILVITKCKHC